MREKNKIENVVKGLGKLPTLPGIAMKILEAVRNEKTSLKEIGDILSTDPPLSAEVLKLINSPFYGIQTEVTSVPHAVNLLGINVVKNLALSFSLLRNYRKGNKDFFDYTLFWKTSLIGAVASKLMAEKVIPSMAEDAFFLGLIHNIGILALNQCMPEQYRLVLNEMEKTLCSHHEAEAQILGFNHMEMGEYLVKTWGLPEILQAPIRHHHDPSKLDSDNADVQNLTKTLHLAALFIDLRDFSDRGFRLAVLEFFFKEYGFINIFQIEDIAEEIHEQTLNVFPLFEISNDTEKSYLEMIEDARRELIDLSTDFMQELLEQKKLIQSLREQATRDALTDLFNYQSFQESLEREVYRVKRYNLQLCIIIADIDHFKNVNDRYGHLAGDHTLTCAAKCLK